MKHYLLFYELATDYLERRGDFRAEHLGKAWVSSERGELVLAGALANPVDGAVLLFKGDSPAVAEQFATTDPYVLNGLVKRWYVREWMTVVGESSAAPVRPALKIGSSFAGDQAHNQGQKHRAYHRNEHADEDAVLGD